MATDDTEKQSPWTRPGFVAAAIVVALVLVLGVVLGIRALNGSPEPGPTAAPPTSTAAASETPAPAPSESADDDPSVCGLEGVETAGSVTAAPEAEWALVGTTAAPATAAGPGVVEESGFRYCFARTPEGALLAAANVVAMGADPTLADDMTDRLIAKGPGRDAALEQLSASGGGGSTRVQIAGFNVLAYSGDEATVDVAIRTSSGAVGAIAYALVWEDGDWKVRLSDDGALLNPPVQLPDLTGYIPWAGA